MPNRYADSREGPNRKGVRGTVEDRLIKNSSRGRRCFGEAEHCLRTARVKVTYVDLDPQSGEPTGEPYERTGCRMHAKISYLGRQKIQEEEY